MSRPARREWSTRTAKDRQDSATRAALLDAAEELFAEQGCDQTPVGQIAERAEVSRATFYVYFASRAEVFHALAHRVRDEITRVQREAGRASADPRVVVETSIRAALAVYARKARLLTVIRHQALHDPEAAALWRELVDVPTEIDARFLADLRRTRGAEPAAGDTVVATVVTAALLHLAEEVAADPSSLDRTAAELVAVYGRLAGLDGD
ncbi:TetR/AcrR family transcriptional regulator [Pseudonocardia sp. RS11V-5]|uniref:TetR/AcrR family transcriptional regulator n=1 Tax=Pseudonocardia terrae TaxID=2905831 RepID=UPI001E491033|nr:TetR/AcrR family transcriptional regulator [Pseudonocardia terrae]MCE3554663.1 TetR/AcrR family transcriptional regulator [Pseudonocardia terrae]